MWKTKFPRFYKTTIFKIKKNFKKYNKKVNIFQQFIKRWIEKYNHKAKKIVILIKRIFKINFNKNLIIRLKFEIYINKLIYFIIFYNYN